MGPAEMQQVGKGMPCLRAHSDWGELAGVCVCESLCVNLCASLCLFVSLSVLSLCECVCVCM